MDFLTLLIIIYAIKSAIEDTRSGWRTSKAAYMRSADARFPDAPKSRRAARALQHDTGYWAGQAVQGFPAARHGFVIGWRAGRHAQVEGSAAREKAKAEHLETRARLAPQVAGFRARQQAALRQIRSLRRPVPGNDIDGTCLYCGAGDGQECEPDCPYLNMNWREVDRVKRERVQAQGEGREEAGEGSRPTRRVDGKPETEADRRFFDLRESGYTGPIDQDGNIPGKPTYSFGPAAATAGWPMGDDASGAHSRARHMSTDGKPWVVTEYPPGGGPGKTVATYLRGREVTGEGGWCDAVEAGRHERCNAPGCACPCHVTTEAPAAGAGRQLGSQPERYAITEGTPSMAVAADTTYDGMLMSLAAAKNVAEGHAAELRQARQQALQQSEQMQALEVDSITLGAIADHIDARAAAVDAQNRVLETAELVELALKRGHARLAEAHQDAPVQAAQREFYAG